MNFFEQQEKSRSRTGLLVFLFTVALIGLFSVLYGVAVFLYITDTYPPNAPFQYQWLWQPGIFFGVLAFLLLIVGLRTLWQIVQLSKGGSYVAESLGGRLINAQTAEPLERRLVNIVEEMAIASGTPVPSVYVLDNEQGINAFAAGFSGDDAAVAVTRGTLTQLNRDELQGVIAHEFSHIFNGDMRLNIRLIAVLSGIMALAVIGYFILRVGPRRGKAAAATFAAGLTLLVLGYSGVFVGRIIQSAISRQREFLADASAVQFTRNPNGISGALKKIGGYSSGSGIQSPRAQEVGHMFFSMGVGGFLSGLFATHPPLEERIRKIDPNFKGEFDTSENGGLASLEAESARISGFAGGGAPQQVKASPEQISGQVGNLDDAHLAYSQGMLARLPESLKQELASSFGATLTVYALLLDRDSNERRHQFDVLAAEVSEQFATTVMRLGAQIDTLPAEYRLSLLDLALPALRQLSAQQYQVMLRLIHVLVTADDKISLFEFCVQHIIRYRLHHVFDNPSAKATLKSLKQATTHFAELVGYLAYVGADDDAEAKSAYEAAMQRLGLSPLPPMPPDRQEDLQPLQQALEALSHGSAAIRGQALDACAHCVLFDGVVTVEEGELLRAVAYSLGLPLPPFLTQGA